MKKWQLITLIALPVLIFSIAGIAIHSAKNEFNSRPKLETTSISKKKAEKSDKKEVAKQESVADPYASWKSFSSSSGLFSLKYPEGWSSLTCGDDSTLFLAPNATALGRCNSDAGSQIMVTSSTGDNRSSYTLSASQYPDLKTEAVVVDGVSGNKFSGTFKSTPGAGGIGPVDGDKQINYVFYTNGRTYAAMYVQKASYSDVSTEFNQMVSDTFSFKQ